MPDMSSTPRTVEVARKFRGCDTRAFRSASLIISAKSTSGKNLAVEGHLPFTSRGERVMGLRGPSTSGRQFGILEQFRQAPNGLAVASLGVLPHHHPDPFAADDLVRVAHVGRGHHGEPARPV